MNMKIYYDHFIYVTSTFLYLKHLLDIFLLQEKLKNHRYVFLLLICGDVQNVMQNQSIKSVGKKKVVNSPKTYLC